MTTALNPTRECAVNGCEEPHCARGMCRRCYFREYTAGTLPIIQPHTMVMWDEDYDEVVVDRLVTGQRVDYTSVERLEAVRVLRHRGLSYPRIAARIGIAERQVHRDLDRLGLVQKRRASEPENAVVAGIIETAPSGLEPDSTPDLHDPCAYRRRTG